MTSPQTLGHSRRAEGSSLPRRARAHSLARAAVVSLVALVLIGVTVNGGNSYSCPAGDASDLSLCEVQR